MDRNQEAAELRGFGWGDWSEGHGSTAVFWRSGFKMAEARARPGEAWVLSVGLSRLCFSALRITAPKTISLNFYVTQ